MKTIPVTVLEEGRLTLPAEVRQVLDVQDGGQVMMTIEDGSVRVTTPARTLERVRAPARPHMPKDRLASDELIAERRAEAEAHLLPAIDRDRDRVDAAMERIRARRGTLGRITAEEVLSARDEGRK
jgi:bifunctional DNA-binding transcriptional regulator/antitoxin component of YhaV-PrlF toxin-antitoxin module